MSESASVHPDTQSGFEIVVNAEKVVVRDARVNWDQVVDLAFPGGREDPQAIFEVDFEDAASKPNSGPLAEGEHVEVERSGTEFSVIRSVRS